MRERIRDLEQRYHGLTADNTGLQARVREANDLLDRNRREMAVLETLRIRISTFSQDPQFAQKAKNILDNIDSCYGFYGSNHKESGMLDYIDHELLGLSSLRIREVS